MARKPHIHVMAICHKHGPMQVEIVPDLDGMENYLDGLVDMLMKVESESEVEIIARNQHSLEFRKKSTLDGAVHEFMVTYSYCPRIMSNCQLRQTLDIMDRMDMDSDEVTEAGMVASLDKDGVMSVQMLGGDLKDMPQEVRDVIEKIAEMITESGIGKQSAPDLERIVGSERDSINKRFNELMGL